MSIGLPLTIGFFGYNTYRCLLNYQKEAQKTNDKIEKLLDSVTSIDNYKNSRCSESAIVSIPLTNPIYYYDIQRLSRTKHIEFRHHFVQNDFTGKRYEIMMPTEVEKIIKTQVAKILSDPTLGFPTITTISNLFADFKTPPQIVQSDGQYLEKLLGSHKIKTLYGHNEVFETRITTINQSFFAMGSFVGKDFVCDGISDRPEPLAKYIAMKTDKSTDFLVEGIISFCFVFPLVVAVSVDALSKSH